MTEINKERVDYATTATPSDYKCGKCGAAGCKLWRAWNSFVFDLHCAECACKRKGIPNNVRADGRRVIGESESEYCAGETTDQIGFYAPAVPTEENDACWGYSSVPQPGVEWWRRLPLVGAPAAAVARFDA